MSNETSARVEGESGPQMEQARTYTMDEWKSEYLSRFEANGHKPERTEDGDVDWFGYDPGGVHNGLRCTICGWGRCMWCLKNLDVIPKCELAAAIEPKVGESGLSDEEFVKQVYTDASAVLAGPHNLTQGWYILSFQNMPSTGYHATPELAWADARSRIEAKPEPPEGVRGDKCPCGAWVCRTCLSCSSDCGCAEPNVPCDCWFKERQMCDICQGCPAHQPVPCPSCSAPIFVRANGTVVAHYDGAGNKCMANEKTFLSLVSDEPKPEPLPNTFQEEPLPCPFCGCAPRVGEHSSTDETGERYGYNYIECEHSGSFSVIVHADSPEDCLRSWNTRLAAPKVVDSKEEHSGDCPDECPVCKPKVEEQDGEQELPPRPQVQGGDYRPHYRQRETDAFIEALEAKIQSLTAGNTKWLMKQAVHLFQIGLRIDDDAPKLAAWRNDRAEKAEAENKLLKSESVAPPSLPTQEFDDWYRENRKSIRKEYYEQDRWQESYLFAKAGWNASRAAAPVALPTHREVERTIADDDYVGLRCSCGRIFVGLGDEALASSRASFEAHLPEKEGK